MARHPRATGSAAAKGMPVIGTAVAEGKPVAAPAGTGQAMAMAKNISCALSSGASSASKSSPRELDGHEPFFWAGKINSDILI